MSHRDPELRDPALRRALRNAMADDRAPLDWVEQALAIPELAPPARVRSRLRLLVPHLCGLGLLVGLVIALFLRPDAIANASALLARSLPSGISFSLESFSQGELLAMLATPVLIYFLYQGSRGFPVLHRHR